MMVKRETPEIVKCLVQDGKVVGLNATYDESEDESEEVVRIPGSESKLQKEIDEPEGDVDFGNELKHASPVLDDESDLRVQGDVTDSEIDDEEMKKKRQKQDKVTQKAELSRKHRGPMNIKALRHLKFSKDEAKVFDHKIKSRFSMNKREPGVKTEL